MSRKQTATIIALSLTVFLFLFIKSNQPAENVQTDKKINITTTFYPLFEFSRQVGGEHVSVVQLTPDGVEPHDFEPTPQDIITIKQSRIFIYNGAGLDGWVEKLIPDVQGAGIEIINMSDHISLLAGSAHEDAEEQNGEEVSENDPHYWLDPVNVQKEIELIRDALVKIDPKHQKIYLANAGRYIAQLQKLDQQFRKGLADCTLREVIVAHDAYQYLAKRYGIISYHIAGLSPDAEPNPKQMAEIIDIARKKKIEYIFFETLIDSRLARTIADEIGAETLVLHPIEGLTIEQKREGKDYISLMEDNLHNLQKALSCQ